MVVQGSEREGFAEDHSQAKPRDVSWTTFNNKSEMLC